MPNLRGIKIVTLSGGKVEFQPDVPGAQPGQALGVANGDLVTWNNRTNDSHWPHAMGIPLTGDIPAGQVSSPILQVTNSITYTCKYHRGEQGNIVVVGALVVASASAGSKSKKRIKKKKSKRRKKQTKRSRK